MVVRPTPPFGLKRLTTSDPERADSIYSRNAGKPPAAALQSRLN